MFEGHLDKVEGKKSTRASLTLAHMYNTHTHTHTHTVHTSVLQSVIHHETHDMYKAYQGSLLRGEGRTAFLPC